MEWFVTNWFWLLVGIAFVALHLFGHGSHGGHGGHGGGGRPQPTDESEKSGTPASSVSRSDGGHHH